MFEEPRSAAKVGFAILSFNEPHQLHSLTRVLSEMFTEPPIVCHHNFDQCDLDPKFFPQNVRFVRPHIRTRWGHITTPLAALKAFSLLRNESDPDWYFLLSGSDYPVAPAEKILIELSSTRYDVYLEHCEISGDTRFSRIGWLRQAYDRYYAHRLSLPRIATERLFSGRIPFRREYLFIRNPRMLRWIEWNRPPRIFSGTFWFHGNRKAIYRLLDSDWESTLRYFRRRPIPEESLFHTILCKSDLHICNDNKRYMDWTEGGWHPKWLTVSDLPKIIASGAFFARKFRPDGIVQRTVNEELRVSI
jgi:hypothetical protein